MIKYIIVVEYQVDEFMNIDKIMTFKQNLEKVKDKGKTVKLLLYGDHSDEELAICMSYLNKLLQEEI